MEQFAHYVTPVFTAAKMGGGSNVHCNDLLGTSAPITRHPTSLETVSTFSQAMALV
jgi:hypothetical protein